MDPSNDMFKHPEDFKLYTHGVFDDTTGVISGSGGHFYDRFSSDIFPHDYVVVNGARAKPPRYYDKMLKRFDEETFDFIKEEREYKASLNRLDNTFDRLGVKEQVAVARISTLKRSLK